MTRRQFMKVSVGLGAAVGVKAQAKVSQQPLTRRCEPMRGDQKRITLPAKVIEDKIRGGLVGQLLGNLNGLPHEFKYLDEPGDVRDYLPALPQGAWTDDDTDIEWVYVLQMQKQHTLFVPHREIPRLWQSHINRRIWSSNLYARQLMDLGIEPPDTGLPVLNPWAEFNIAGQFCSETFGLISPALPQTAAKIGCHYTSVVVSGEPLQATQLFTAMIATAFITDDLQVILDAGEKACDPKSRMLRVVQQVRSWHQQYPNDWRSTRLKIKETYDIFGKSHRGRNGYEINTACVIAALLYGEGDFVRSLTMAFNFGWDADCNAATVGTILGVCKGWNWMQKQGWNIQDIYRNTTREGMPQDETITRFGDRLIELAQMVVTQAGGHYDKRAAVYHIPHQQPCCVHPLAEDERRIHQLAETYSPERLLEDLCAADERTRARAAYLAIALGYSADLRKRYRQIWEDGLAALEKFPKVVQAIYYYTPATELGEKLRRSASEAGLHCPSEKIPLWI
ncbi:ADP-ribosylglycohydrolase family protein [Fervidibacter sacchari]